MTITKTILNIVVRTYLSRFPITEGKKYILRWMKNRIMPEQSVTTFRTKHGFHLEVNLRNAEHQRMYFYGEHDERYEINNLTRIVRIGDTCWDIGANIGFYTCLFASLVGKSGRVVAFEPASATLAYLRKNIALNRFNSDQVVVINKAIGDEVHQKRIFFNVADMAEGTASLKAEQGSATEMVQMDTLDNLYPTLPRPDLIKIDVEGYQLEVLAGGKKFLSCHHPMIMAELRDNNPDTVRRAQNYLRDLGYSFYEFRKHSLARCVDITTSTKRNFFMVKQESPYFSRLRISD